MTDSRRALLGFIHDHLAEAEVVSAWPDRGPAGSGYRIEFRIRGVVIKLARIYLTGKTWTKLHVDGKRVPTHDIEHVIDAFYRDVASVSALRKLEAAEPERVPAP